MRVLKRNKQYELVSFDKISARISRLAQGLPHVDPLRVAQSTIRGVYDGVPTADLDTLGE
jgi:ribonucleoside-diphosphate reductase alpha chain